MIITSLLSLTIALQSPAPSPPAVVPQNALQRTAPKLWGLEFSVVINTLDVENNKRPFRMPLIIDGPWSQMADENTLHADTFSGNTIIQTKRGKEAVKGTGLMGESMIQLEVPLGPARFSAMRLQAEVASWGAAIDEKLAQQSSWPTKWPEQTKAALQPQAMIESKEPIFKRTIDTIFEGNIQRFSPWIAAKKIVQFTCENVQLTGGRSVYGRMGTRGLNMQGALLTAESGMGSRSDLVCTCVAMLRAAGIPARPVVGLSEEVDNGKELTTWAEFFLPGSGWVPFSPWQMKNAGMRSWKLDRSWRFFGNWKDLNENIPISWTFAPGDGTTVHDTWGVWGWTRAVTGAEIPIMEKNDESNVEFFPSKISARMISGSSLNERSYRAWLEGTTRPLIRRNK
ncbi:MAG: hypothetical protein CMJ40_00595 [Phycisphaerae bacterium]|nr:hypothetical protein [Phycisphaerae bacterium]